MAEEAAKVKITGVYIFTAHDGTQWAVPLDLIARDRAKHYAHEFGGDLERSLQEDTLPLFRQDAYEVEDWACNNMNWSDVAEHAQQLVPPEITDRQEDWVNPRATKIQWSE